jgi:hypothetical protein
LKKLYPNELRRPKGHFSPLLFNYIQERNPWPIVWWSAAFPGSGHLILCKNLTGALLMLWEFFINAKAHINEAIVLSMIGEFELAKTVLDTRWFLLYISVYIFAMWDCYTTAVDLNKYSKLADRLNSPILPFKISGLEINYLDYRKPWSGAIWSFLTPGVGSIYCNRLSIGFFVLICFISTVYYSNLLPGVHLTFEGNTNLAAAVMNPQWFINLPSILLFSVSSTYHDILFTNELFKVEQSRYLADHFQPLSFNMPKTENTGDSMHFISTFSHSAFLELALSDLEQNGIGKGNIFAAPLDKYSNNGQDVKMAHQEGASKYELSFIFAAIFMLLGSIYGFILAWGPIIWAAIGLVIGATLGLVTSYFIKKADWHQKKGQTEVILIVECEKQQSEVVEQILWQHKALGLTKTS